MLFSEPNVVTRAFTKQNRLMISRDFIAHRQLSLKARLEARRPLMREVRFGRNSGGELGDRRDVPRFPQKEN